jgi:hypothetical protein
MAFVMNGDGRSILYYLYIPVSFVLALEIGVGWGYVILASLYKGSRIDFEIH